MIKVAHVIPAGHRQHSQGWKMAGRVPQILWSCAADPTKTHSMLICSLMAASHSVVKVRPRTNEPLAPSPLPPWVFAVEASTGATSGGGRKQETVHGLNVLHGACVK